MTKKNEMSNFSTRASLPVVLTPSEAEKASACYRKHAIGDILSKHRGRSIYTSFGTVIHDGVAGVWWQTGDLDLVVAKVRELWESEVVAHDLHDHKEVHTLADRDWETGI